MFCKQCGSLLFPKKKDGKTIIECSCGYKEVSENGIKLSDKNSKEEKEVEVIEKEFETRAKCKERCPKCGHCEAFYHLVQTRAGDEPETKFLKCTKCGHSWRDYD